MALCELIQEVNWFMHHEQLRGPVSGELSRAAVEILSSRQCSQSPGIELYGLRSSPAPAPRAGGARSSIRQDRRTARAGQGTRASPIRVPDFISIPVSPSLAISFQFPITGCVNRVLGFSLTGSDIPYSAAPVSRRPGSTPGSAIEIMDFEEDKR
ncbi:hypothetical protein AbraIFM66951_010669 [Aspergillus brasiliensis]|uniref:Uncharacterized protein n=1 Tax=Aspergillus brasiliensis TaxID=319629 RepID=A0A9W5YH19_9EURO|nr:hypothetical protein AbraCBS73388_005938 [Aspergillus brasiliensis]GKZ47313.1 hypothetical protein AbraIFM66951_010669 [Aspergillus brasiliensis]